MAQRGAALMTIAGSTRVVEGSFSVCRRKIPVYVAGPMNPDKISERMLIYTYPEETRETPAELGESRTAMTARAKSRLGCRSPRAVLIRSAGAPTALRRPWLKTFSG